MQSISKEEGTTQMRVQHQTERTINDGVGRERRGRGNGAGRRKKGRKAGRKEEGDRTEGEPIGSSCIVGMYSQRQV